MQELNNAFVQHSQIPPILSCMPLCDPASSLFQTIPVLHEIKNDQIGDVLLAGVFDGHAGTAASKTARSLLPSLFTSELLTAQSGAGESVIREALEKAWETTCDTYRSGCDEMGECVAGYDPREGILFAETGSTDLVGKYRIRSS